jgi:hypothetical protein
MITRLLFKVSEIKIENMSRNIWICRIQTSFGNLKIIMRLNMFVVEFFCFFFVISKCVCKRTQFLDWDVFSFIVFIRIGLVFYFLLILHSHFNLIHQLRINLRIIFDLFAGLDKLAILPTRLPIQHYTYFISLFALSRLSSLFGNILQLHHHFNELT